MPEADLFTEFLSQSATKHQGVALDHIVTKLVKSNNYLNVTTSNYLIRQATTQLQLYRSSLATIYVNPPQEELRALNLENILKYVIQHPQRANLLTALSSFYDFNFWSCFLNSTQDATALQQAYAVLMPKTIPSGAGALLEYLHASNQIPNEVWADWLKKQDSPPIKDTPLVLRGILNTQKPFSPILFDAFVDLLSKDILKTNVTTREIIIRQLLLFTQGNVEAIKKVIPFINENAPSPHVNFALIHMRLPATTVPLLLKHNPRLINSVVVNSNLLKRDYNALILTSLASPSLSPPVFTALEVQMQKLSPPTTLALYQHFLQNNTHYPKNKEVVVEKLIHKLFQNNYPLHKLLEDVDLIKSSHYKEVILLQLLYDNFTDSQASLLILQKLDPIRPYVSQFYCEFAPKNTQPSTIKSNINSHTIHHYFFKPDTELVNFVFPRMDKGLLLNNITHIDFKTLSVDNLQYLWKIKKVRETYLELFFEHPYVIASLDKQQLRFVELGPKSPKNTTLKMKVLGSFIAGHKRSSVGIQ